LSPEDARAAGSAPSALADAALGELTGTKLKAVAALLRGLAVLAVSTDLLARRRAGPGSPAVEAEPNQGDMAADEPKPKADAQGGPLSRGAVARLRTTRYRFAGSGATFLPDEATVVSLNNGHAIELCGARTGRLARAIDTVNFSTGESGGPALSRDVRRLAVNGSMRDGTRPAWRSPVCVFDLVTDKDIRTFERSPREGVNARNMTPDGKLVSTLDSNGKPRIEEGDSGAELLRQRFPGDVIASLAVSPDGSMIALGSGPNTHKLFVWR